MRLWAAHPALVRSSSTRSAAAAPFRWKPSSGRDAFASDLNPIPVLLNKVVLEYIPKYGQRLADEVRKWGEWIKKEAEKELAEFYPKDTGRRDAYRLPLGTDDPMRRPRLRRGSTAHPLALVGQEGAPFCGGATRAKPEGPIAWTSKSSSSERDGWVDQAIPKPKSRSDIRWHGERGSATCPCCGYTTPVAHVREQLKSTARRGRYDCSALLRYLYSRNRERPLLQPSDCP